MIEICPILVNFSAELKLNLYRYKLQVVCPHLLGSLREY